MTSFATVEEFEARHGPVDATGPVAERLEDATALVLEVAEGGTAGWVEDPDAAIAAGEVPRTIKQVTLDAAYRAWSNPDAANQMSSQDQNLSTSRQAPDALFLTGREERRVLRAASRSSMRSVTLVSPWSGDGDEVLTL